MKFHQQGQGPYGARIEERWELGEGSRRRQRQRNQEKQINIPLPYISSSASFVYFIFIFIWGQKRAREAFRSQFVMII
jgi:hypothetical protein